MAAVCPAILQGYSKSCRDAQGGTKVFYITEKKNIATFTQASGVLLTFTMNPGTKFWKYEQELNTANGQEVATGNRQAGSYFVDQTFNATLLKRQAAVAYGLRAISQQDVVIIETEQTGTSFVFGLENGLSMETGTSTTGVVAGDKNGYDLVWKGNEPNFAPEISNTLITAVT